MNNSRGGTAEGILYTDFYQLTMAQLYFRTGLHEQRAQFDHFFRNCPDYGSHQAGYCVNAGLEWLLDWMKGARFRETDIEYLRNQRGRTGRRLFADDFLDWLARYGSFDAISIQSVPEGRVIHPGCPLNIVEGPLAMAQILETPLLNYLNFQTLIATKAARIHEAARRRPVIEFGMRRAQDKGATAGARAALIGGADFTSNTAASRALGFHPKGTHAHSMVQAFMALGKDEIDSFRAYAEVFPDDCLLLVDTVNTLESGVPNAIKVFEELKLRGHVPLGIRLDSGDLAHLSIMAAKMLNDAGFPDAVILLSNQLDEMVIWQIISQIEAEASRYGVDPDNLISRLTFGVGTRLITSHGDPALDGVYKLTALEKKGKWIPAIKISESVNKILNPGPKQVWRLYDRRGRATADIISTRDESPREMPSMKLHHPTEEGVSRTVHQREISEIEPLLIPILHDGRLIYDLPSIEQMRRSRDSDMDRLDAGVKRMISPHRYHVSLSERLWNLKQEMVASLKTGAE
jgi:nicotinate phosphoribosyltransferase